MSEEKKIKVGSAVRIIGKYKGDVPHGVLGLVVGTINDLGATEEDPLFMVMARGKKDAYWTEELELHRARKT